MLLIVGLFLIVVGISDFVIAALLTRQQAPASGLGGGQTPVAARVLRRTGVITIVIGVVLAVIGLVS